MTYKKFTTWISEDKKKKYVGEMKDGVQHGLGTFNYNDGEKHEGEWKNGYPDGQGTYIHSDGEEYVGEFERGEIHGQGINTFPDGDKFVGEFKEGNIWNVKHYDKEGKVTETCVNGKWINQ